MFNRLVALPVAVALAVVACTDPEHVDSVADAGTSGPTLTPEREVNPASLALADWPDDLLEVVFFPADDGVVIVGFNGAGQPISHVELAEVNQSNDVVRVRARFADAKAWAVMDIGNGSLVSAGGEPDEMLTEISERAAAMIALAEEQEQPDPNDPQAGPWLDCALSVLGAVVACIPVGGGWVVTCPKAIVGAVCTCHGAAKSKKKKKKPQPAVCDG